MIHLVVQYVFGNTETQSPFDINFLEESLESRITVCIIDVFWSEALDFLFVLVLVPNQTKSTPFVNIISEGYIEKNCFYYGFFREITLNIEKNGLIVHQE